MTPSPHDAGRQRYLDFHARCHQAFTPFAPIRLPDFFAGRLDVVRRVANELDAPGRHVAIFGERGVGKTSLAELLSFFTSFEPDRVHVVRCGHDSTFESIFAEFLERFASGLSLESVESEGALEGSLRLGPVGAGGETRQRRVYRNLAQTHSISRSRLLGALASAGALLIVDEFDRVRHVETHTRMAELIKAFSDSGSRSKIVIVGVADSIRGLIGEHTSLSRSLAQVKLDRMSREDLAEIIRRGEDRIGLSFRPTVTNKIVALADGFPHYVHLIALYASLRAIEALLERPALAELVVDEEEYGAGVEEAIRNSEYTLIEAYDDAVITTRRRSDIYELILHAIAMGDEAVAQVQDIASHASTLAGRELRPAQLSTALGRLTRRDKGRSSPRSATGTTSSRTR